METENIIKDFVNVLFTNNLVKSKEVPKNCYLEFEKTCKSLYKDFKEEPEKSMSIVLEHLGFFIYDCHMEGFLTNRGELELDPCGDKIPEFIINEWLNIINKYL